MKILLIFSIEDFVDYKKFGNIAQVEKFVNEKNEYAKDFKVLECVEISANYEVEAVEYVVRYDVKKA